MKLTTLIGRADPDQPDALAAARAERARSVSAWTEIPATRLVPRARGWLVDAETDLVYVPLRGAVFEPESTNLFAAERAPLAFTVDDDDVVRVYERLRHPKTWSDVVRRDAMRGASS